jgi:hypothetical protein
MAFGTGYPGVGGGLISGIFGVHHVMTETTAEGGRIREFHKLIATKDQYYYSYCPSEHEEKEFLTASVAIFHGHLV